MSDSALDKLKTAFINALGVASDADFEAMAYGRTAGWDSVAHMSLINEIEVAFDIMLSTDDVIGMDCFAKARDIVTRNGVVFT